MSDSLEFNPVMLPDGLGIPAEDWQQTPTSMQQLLSLLKRIEAFAARANRNSSNASRPPSTDAPAKKRQRRTQAAERRKTGAKPGNPGHQQVLREPTATMALLPDACACGHSGFADLMPY